MESTRKVAHIFDDMRDDYDEISDLWYAWLFSRIHFFIARYTISKWTTVPQKVLDIGCGTGFQSFLYASVGAKVHGLDISEQLIAAANEKVSYFKSGAPLFPENFSFVHKYNERIRRYLDERLVSHPTRPTFTVGNAQDTGLPSGEFDHVNCCGSVLSFLEDHNACLREIHRLLRPGGTFVLEVEAKYNLDLIWPIADSLIGGKIGYETTVREALSPFGTPIEEPVKIEFPFGEKSNPVYMDIKLFSKRGLRRDLVAAGLQTVRWRTINSFTNVIPSPFSDSAHPSRLMKASFRTLAFLEEMSPFDFPGASFVIFGNKR